VCSIGASEWVERAEPTGSQTPPFTHAFESSRLPFHDETTKMANILMVRHQQDFPLFFFFSFFSLIFISFTSKL